MIRFGEEEEEVKEVAVVEKEEDVLVRVRVEAEGALQRHRITKFTCYIHC